MVSAGSEPRPSSKAWGWGKGPKLQTPGGGDRGPCPAAPAQNCRRDRRDGFARQRGAGRGATHTHQDSGRRRLLRGNSRPAAPAARPRPGPLGPARATVPPFRPPTTSLARQQIHSMVLCSVSAALATTEFHSVASGPVWSGSSPKIPIRVLHVGESAGHCGPAGHRWYVRRA